jgi:hypothetical protein
VFPTDGWASAQRRATAGVSRVIDDVALGGSSHQTVFFAKETR